MTRALPTGQVSVVIAALRDDSMLAMQLSALQNQSVANFEIIVSINGAIGGLFGAFGRSSEFGGVTVIDSRERGGPSYARNRGWRSCESEYVLFCDADDVVSRDWVGEMVLALSTHPIVGGRMDYALLNRDRDARWFGRGAGALPVKFNHLAFAPSSNLGIHRKVLLALDGFDEELRHGEDIDLCWRAAYAGHPISPAASAVVNYRLRTSMGAIYRQAYNYGWSDAPLLSRHAAFGARRRGRDTLRDLRSVARALTLSPVCGEGFGNAAYRVGNLAGRIGGTIHSRRWVV